jgi:hypothetical protein
MQVIYLKMCYGNQLLCDMISTTRYIIFWVQEIPTTDTRAER